MVSLPKSGKVLDEQFFQCDILPAQPLLMLDREARLLESSLCRLVQVGIPRLAVRVDESTYDVIRRYWLELPSGKGGSGLVPLQSRAAYV